MGESSNSFQAQSNLGRLSVIDPRKVWKDEARDFTPWLSQKENLDILGMTIGIDFDSQTTEHPVGNFSADIRCKDVNTGGWVVIENQLEDTDHSHLGQLLTYAAGIKAETAIWITSKVRDEHREAVNWLNENTSDKISIFAVQIELLQIGDSAIAPRFNIICEPNLWARAERIAAEGLTLSRQNLFEYWNQFADLIRNESKVMRPRKVSPSPYMVFSIGVSDCRLAVAALSQDKLLRVQLNIEGPFAKERHSVLEEHKQAIESAIGSTLTWSEKGIKREGFKVYVERPSDPLVQADWEQQQRWLYEMLHRFYDVFTPRLRQLSFNSSSEDVEASLAE